MGLRGILRIIAILPGILGISPAASREMLAAINFFHGNQPVRWKSVRPSVSPAVQPVVTSAAEPFTVSISGNRNVLPARMVVDRSGNIYIAGTVWLANPALPPPSHAFDGDVLVTKLDPTGHVLYTTYFGGDGLDELRDSGRPSGQRLYRW